MQRMNNYNGEDFKRKYKELYDVNIKFLDSFVEEQIQKGEFFDLDAVTPYGVPESQRIGDVAGKNPRIGYLRDQIVHGKKGRPIVLDVVHEGYNGSKPYEAIKVGAAVELEHIASKIHDDLIDEDTTRYGVDTVWHFYAKQDFEKNKVPVISRYEKMSEDLEKQKETLSTHQNIEREKIPENLVNGYFEEMRHNLETDKENELQRVWEYSVTEGKKKAGLFAQYLVGLSRTALQSAKIPEKREDIFRIMEETHIKLTNGENREINLRNYLKERKNGLEGVTEKDYFEIADNKACLYDAACEMGFILAIDQRSLFQKIDDALKPEDYVGSELKLIKRFAKANDRMLQITDDALITSKESGKNPHSDIGNGVPTLHLILLYNDLKEKGNGDLGLLIDTFGNKKTDPRNYDKIIEMIKSYGIDERIEKNYISNYIQEMKDSINQTRMRQESKSFLLYSAQEMVGRKF